MAAADATDLDPTTENARTSETTGKITSKTVFFTSRTPVHAYLHLRQIKNPNQPALLDETTVSMHLDSALCQWLGFHGSAIPIDFMKLEAQDVWIRLPHDDRPALVAALSSWSGRAGDAYRVMGWSSWDANAYGHDAGQELFTE